MDASEQDTIPRWASVTGVPESHYWETAHTITERVERALGLTWDVATFADVRRAIISGLEAESEDLI